MLVGLRRPGFVHLNGGRQRVQRTGCDTHVGRVFTHCRCFLVDTTNEQIDVTAWGKTAEIIEKYVTKGKEIAIEGKLTHRSYDDKNGEKRYVTDIVVNEVLLLGK